ncbi:MAG TPA: DNA repair and recombination protein RadA [Candidatus Nanoarchaeia archaeon]|nr:DNA repair and recombination protein RadA [Candidatus Nanoarchaeia archaeon]
MVKKKEEELEEISVEEITDISELPGIGKGTAEKLKAAGYNDIMSIAVATAVALADVAEMSKPTALKAIQAARIVAKIGFKSGDDFLRDRESTERISTGSTALNGLLGGGVETRGITEAFGEFGSGKSQLGFQLVVNAQLPKEQGGLGGQVIFVDTEGTFSPERIVQLAKAAGLDPVTVLKNTRVARAYSSDHQMLLVDKIDELIRNEGVNVKLIVIDSLTSLFRSEFAGRGSLADRQQKINRHLHTLQKLADVHGLAIFMTNQVMANPAIFFGNPTQAIGGHIVGHAATYRLYLRKSKGEKRIARLIDSPHLPEGEAVFNVTTEGIKDVEK